MTGRGDVCDPLDDRDPDADGIWVGDNCPAIFNPLQEDLDSDGKGDVCDEDRDGDGVKNEEDSSPWNYNPCPPEVRARLSLLLAQKRAEGKTNRPIIPKVWLLPKFWKQKQHANCLLRSRDFLDMDEDGVINILDLSPYDPYIQ